MTKISIVLAIVIIALGFANENSNANRPNHPMGPPPKEAIDVCLNQEEDSVCQLTSPRGETLEGICKTTPDKEYFACMPKRSKQD